MEKYKGCVRTVLLSIGILSICIILLVFKYYNFIIDDLRIVCAFLGLAYTLNNLSILLPIGLSFHTFQSLSYVIDVYRGRQKAENHFGIYSLYVMFYPQLVAGPIERPQNMLHQFYEEHSFDHTRVCSGLKLMFWGFFKKLVIADRLSIYVDMVYNNHALYNGVPLLMATIFFSFQIYCDFSGYSDIARGSARVLGFDLMVNFRRPYFASSIREFWTRWHISLSTWFRDYVYFPLGGNRVSKMRWCFNILVVFAISGIWHGANWTFVIWGFLHGVFLIAYDLLAQANHSMPLRVRGKIPRALGCICTFCLVSFLWIFFRSDSIGQAVSIISKITSISSLTYAGPPLSQAFYGLLAISMLIIIECDIEFFGNRGLISINHNAHVRTLAYCTAVLSG
jgi:D-alanyl-lipoteichoic acid acyltransferase DltB (MBOAT superfamily)